MPANITPIFTLTPHIGLVTIATANTARDGTGTLGSVLTGGVNGSRVDRVTIEATGTTTAGMVRLFISNGTTAFLWKEVPVSAVTPSGTVPAFSFTITSPDLQAPLLVLPSGYILQAGTNNAESFAVIAQGGDY